MAAATVAAAAMAGWVALLPRSGEPSTPRATAAALHAEGLAALARGDVSLMSDRFDQALDADSTFVPALIDRSLLDGFDPATQERYQRLIAGSHPLGRCADGVTTQALGTTRIPLDDGDASVCGRVQRMFVQYQVMPATERARVMQAAYDEFPESVYLYRLLLDEIAAVRAFDSLLALTGPAHWRSDLHRAYAEFHAPVALHILRRHEEAIVREKTAARAPLGLAARFLLDLGAGNHGHLYHHPLSPHLRQHVDSSVGLARARLGQWEALPVLTMRMSHGLSFLRMQLDAGRLHEALSLGPALMATADSVGTPLARGEAALAYGRAAVKAGENTRAEQLLREALYRAREGNVPRIEWEVNHNLLHLYESTGRDSLALEAGLEFARISGEVPIRPERLMSYRDLGMHLRQRGQWQEAQQWFERMVSAVDSVRDGQMDFYAGEYLESVGQLERALSFYNERARRTLPERTLAALTRLSELLGDTVLALRYAEEHDDQGQKLYPEVRPLLPGVLARMGRWEVARTRLRAAREAAAGRGQRASWGRLTTEEARVALEQGDARYALMMADSALPALAGSADREFRMQAVGIGAVAAARIARPDTRARIEALAGERGHAIATGGAVLAADLAIMEGDARRAMGDRRAALAAYHRGQRVVDSLARGIVDDATRSALLATLRRVSTRALELILDRPDEADAVPLWRQWSGYRKARTVPIPVASSTAAPVNRAVVDFAVLDSTIAVLILTPTSAVIRDLRVRPSDVAAQLDRLYAFAAPRIGPMLDASRARLDDHAATALARFLMEPLGSDIEGWERVEVVPDGFLSLVPFDVLPMADGLVLDRHVLSLAPSLYLTGHDAAPLAGHALVVAGTARNSREPPGAPDEAKRVARAITRRNVRTLLPATVTESGVRQDMTGAAIIHLAAHAKPNESRPDYAEVWLAADSTHDGRLQAFEIRTLNLGGATVVLSACETGSGKVAGGEGPMSLARAFMQAGAGHVIATLWPVRESAVDLMEALHVNLDAGMEPPRALREAKRAMLRRGNTPLDLAPFTGLTARR